MDRCVIDEDMLSPLLSFHNLTSLEIRGSHTFRIGDTMLKKMAMSWPHLQRLQLGSGGWAGQSGITLAGLVPLAQHCVELISLYIVVDVTIVDRKSHYSCLTIPRAATASAVGRTAGCDSWLWMFLAWIIASSSTSVRCLYARRISGTLVYVLIESAKE
jgi:hypothetical protein